MSSRPECPSCGEYATLSGCSGGAGFTCKYLKKSSHNCDRQALLVSDNKTDILGQFGIEDLIKAVEEEGYTVTEEE